LLGDLSKWVPTSASRVASVDDSAGGLAVMIIGTVLDFKPLLSTRGVLLGCMPLLGVEASIRVIQSHVLHASRVSAVLPFDSANHFITLI
jgi:hypothetical protein